MKEIYWIDDDFHMMFYVIQGVIKKLWRLDTDEKDDRKVRSNIIIFGNAWADKIQDDLLPSQQDEDNKYMDLVWWYQSCCSTIDGPSAENITYCNNLHLIENSVSFLLKNDNHEDVKKFRSILNQWTELENSQDNDEFYREAQSQVNELIGKMNIRNGAVVGIDLSLLCGDRGRIKGKQRVISMELYNQLKKSHNCFLFSTDAGELDFTQKWKETYVNYYSKKEDNNSSGNIKIYERKYLFEKDNEMTIKDIQQLLDNN